MDDIPISIIVFVLGAFVAFGGIAIWAFIRAGAAVPGEVQKMLQKEHTISDAYKKDFEVKFTMAKYIIGDNSSELTKLRELRVFKEVKEIEIDRVPASLRKEDVAATDPSPVTQECFAMPGVALKRNEYYQVVLGDDQKFEAGTDNMYFINFKLRQRLDVLHPDPKEEGTYIGQPLGTEKFVAEVHFPPTRKLTKVKNKPQLAVYEVHGSKTKQISDKKVTINYAGEIQTREGTSTDMFRLTLLKPPRDADFIIITWQWSVAKLT